MRKLKRAVAVGFGALLLIAGLAAVLAGLLTGGLPVKTVWQGAGFAVMGAAMLFVMIKFPSRAEEASCAEEASQAKNVSRSKEAPRTKKPVSPAEPQKPLKRPRPPKPYPIDPNAPYGSRENPMVVGMPEYSTTLVHDVKNHRWILTDGLGNGWIR